MITFRDTHFQYKERKVLDGVSLTLPHGSFQFLIGPSGSGKSTFLKLCAYELMPTKGEIEIFGENTKNATRNQIARHRRHLGILPQNAEFIDHMSVYENVMLPVLAAGLKPANEEGNVNDLLKWVGLEDRKHSLPKELSGGEQQRVALARTIIMSPEIILADEPTANVDWQMGQRLLELLISLNGLGKTIIIATHDLNLIRASKGLVRTRILRLKSGQIEIAGSEL